MAIAKWKLLQQSADRARKGVDHQKAVELYKQAMAQRNLPWKAVVEITMACAYCHKMLNQLIEADACLSGLAEQASQRGDQATIVRADAELLFVIRKSGDFKRGLKVGQEALNIARQTDQTDLVAEALLSLAAIHIEIGNTQDAQACISEAQPLISPDDTLKQLKAHFISANILGNAGKQEEFEKSNIEALDIARRIGDKDWEGIFLNQLAIFTLDITFRRTLYDQALEAFVDAGDQAYQDLVRINKAVLDVQLGLYKSAIYALRALLDKDQAMGHESICLYELVSLSDLAFLTNDLPGAFAYAEEGLTLALKTGSVVTEYYIKFDLSAFHLANDQPSAADEALIMVEAFPYEQKPEIKLAILAGKAIIDHALGRYSRAKKEAGGVINTLLTSDESFYQIFPVDIFAWTCYLALRPEQPRRRNDKAISRKSWQALELGLKGVLLPIKNMSDAGLRRGYLHREFRRRLIIKEWLKYAYSQGVHAEQIAEFAERVQKPGRLEEVFHRLLNVGVRLNAERDLSKLPEEIVEQVEELTGAERIALILLDDQGKHQSVKSLLPTPAYKALSSSMEPPQDSEAFIREIEPFLEEVAISRQGFIRQVNPDASLLEQKSVLVAPLISQGKLIGIIYTDITGCFGRFDLEDLNLLGVLANQSAVALENANWSATLEQKVADRTAELKESNDGLEQRTAELTILNSVGEAMARTLDVKTVIRIVGDKVRDIFNADQVSISLVDFQNNLILREYSYDVGEGGYVDYLPPSFPLGLGMSSEIIQTKQPLLLGTVEEQNAHGAVLPPEAMERSIIGKSTQSFMGAPIIVNEQVVGLVSLSDYDEHAYKQENLQLLQTLAANMGVAIANARLFQAEQERVNELQIINSIQQGLAAELDFQAIINLVGDKLLQVLHTNDLGIRWYDEKANLLHYLYNVEHGQRISIDPMQPMPGGIFEQIYKSRRPLIGNTLADISQYALTIPGTSVAKSNISVPVISSDRVLGLITIENYEKEYAFGEAEQRLLTTIAASLGTALENARLFDETQRLFKAEQDRVAELEIINSIQQGLAAELDFQAIIDLVGDKLREVFQTPDLGIAWYDENSDLIHHTYIYEHGKRLTPIPPAHPTPTGPFSRMRKSHQLVIWNTAEEGDVLTSGIIPGTDRSISGVMIPIISSDKVLGLIQIENYELEHAFGEAQLRLLTTIAASLGSALENARLFDETQHLLKETEQRNAELAILNSVSQAMSRQLDVDAIIKIVGDQVRDTFKSEVTTIHFYDSKSNLITSAYAYDRGYMNLPPLTYGEGLTSRIIDTREPLVLLSALDGRELGSKLVPNAMGEEGDTKSYLGVPIITGDTVIGVVSVQSYQENAYQASHVSLLSTLASSMGVAIANARLFQAEQERVSELQIINSIQQGLAAELDFQAIVDLVGDKLREVLRTGDLGITWWDEKTDLVHYLYMYEHGKRLSAPPIPPKAGGIYQTMMQTRQPVVFSGDDFPSMDVMPGTDRSKSAVYLPIISSDRFLGDISIENFERENAFGEAEIRLLTTIAASLGTALENARLFNETQRLLKETEQRAAELAILNSVGDAMAKQLDIKTITRLVGDKVREIFASECVVIYLYDPVTEILHPPYCYDKGYIETDNDDTNDTSASTDPIHHDIILERKSLIFGTFQELLNHGAKIWPDAEGGSGATNSFMGVPIIVGEQVRGLVSVQSYQVHAYDETNLRLLSTLASSMGVAIENARLFQETQRLLDETQQRNNELAIINSVQAALAAELDIQGIYNAVGDKIREIFHTGNVDIRIYDPKTNIVSFPYEYEEGVRVQLQSGPLPEKGFGAHVLRTRETLVINENMEQALEKYGSYIRGTLADKSNIWVPLVVGDQSRGLICLSDYQHEHAFSDTDVRLLQTLANSMSVALENARLFAETQRLLEETSQRASELAIINSVSQAMSSQMEVKSIVHTVGDQVRDTLRSEVVNIYLVDPVEKMIHLPYSYDRKYVVSESFPYGTGLTSKVIDTRQPLILRSFEEIQSQGALLSPNAPGDDLMPQSYLGVPIVVGEKAIGVIDVQSYKECVYDDSHVRLLTTLASSMGVALENARLFEETRRLLAVTEQRNRELAIISRIGQALVGQLDPQGIYELVGEELQQVFDAQVVAIITYDRQENMATWRYSIEKGQRQFLAPRPPAGFSGHILQTRQPLLITHEVDQRAAELGSTVLAGGAPKSYLGVPLIAGGEVTGVITLQNIDREEAFNENDLRLLSTLALSMGVALENARLYQETQHHAVEMAALAEIGSDIASTHEMEPVLERMATKTRELMQVRDIAMYLLQPDGHTLKPIVSQGKYAAETLAQTVLMGRGLTGNVVQNGVAEIINEPEHDPRGLHIEGTAPEEEEPECIMIAPLISRGKPIGAMSVYRDRDQGLFTQLELDFLVSLARQAAIAIESARLYAETERRATEMAALAEVSREISATLELQVVLERIAGQACELLAAGNSAVYLLQADGQTIKAIVAQGDIAKEVMADEVQLGSGIIGSIVKSGVAEWIDDTGKDVRSVQIPGTKEITEGEKLMVAPLLAQDKAIGALAVWRDPENPPFNQAELSFAIGLAQQAVVAIENARLFESAQESQRQMADIIDFLPDATLVIDRQGKVIAWNHAIEEMTGVRAADIVGKADYEYSIPFYGERRPILIDMVLMPDEEVEAKYTHIQRNEGILVGEAISSLKGQATYLNATASALRNSKGEAVGAIESIRDVTDQKRAEQELHQAKLEAEQANQAKSAFLAMMSHEIRTPMNAIIGMSGLLMDTPLNLDQREFAETIRTSGDSLLNIINDILDFSKIEAGKMSLEEQPFDLRECIETSLDLIKVRASEKGLELAYQMDAEVPPAILGDVTRLRQVMINLLGNSVKFTDQGEIILSVTRGDQPNSLHFLVSDTGIGIARSRVSQLFRPFTQADASTSRRYGGTGLGLALSSRIVELMGGRIWVESEGIPGKGSTFHFTISAKPALGWKGRPQMQGEQPQLRGRRVLVVDDNATNRRILELQMRSWGMVPKECATPDEALEALQKGEKFDLAILDMHMPDMSGVELADQIRKLESSHPGEGRLPLVLSTSLGGREEARESTEFVAILMKPIRQSALFDMLMSLFGRKEVVSLKPQPERSVLDPEMAAHHPLRILLAEDNVVNQKLALRLLSQMGYRADMAANGLEVLQAVKRQPYDVILMDVQMPEMDGLEATRRLCADLPSEKRPHIVAMTANAMQGDREMCLEAGMDDYLSKPIRVDELVAALKNSQPKTGI